MLTIALGVIMFAAQARSAEIAGSVTDTQNLPVTSAHISVTDQAGNVVGKADADAHGRYLIGAIAIGEYSISLTLPGTKYQGQTIETGVPPEGLCLYWMVSQSAGALATGRPGARAGTCTRTSAAAVGARRDSVARSGRTMSALVTAG
ncbi:MAG: carboxypeptidase-like regulatory domain-containing protein [Candidatus Binatus sp.]